MATIAVTVAGGPAAASFTTLAQSPLAETTDMVEKRLTIGKDAHMLTVRLVQTGGSDSTEIKAVELDVRPYPSATGPSQNP